MKTIFEIEEIRRLRLCVMRELLNMGISIPKSFKSSGTLSRKSKRLQAKAKKENQAGSAIFGMPLCDIPSDFIEGCGYVPRFLVDAVNYIEANIETIGLFRKTGSVHRQKELRRIIENGGSVKCAKLVDDVANLIKQFLREMPESLITSTLEGHFMKALDIDDNDTQLRAITLLCLLLPLDHIGTLRYITIMLSHIVKKCHINKMDCSNLALVMTPNVMYCRNDSSALLCDEKQLSAQTALVELLIKNAELIGTVTVELEEQVQLEISMDMTNTTDDEDCSMDSKIVKKKRRSGSLQGMMSSIEQNLKSWRNKKSSFSNSSTRSDQSSMSSISDCVDASSASSCSLTNTNTHKVPVLRSKRKAEEDPTGLSKKKVRTIVKNLPQQSILSGAAFDLSVMSMSYRGNSTFPASQSMSAHTDTTKDQDTAALFTSASFTQDSSSKKRFPSPFRRKVHRIPSMKGSGSSTKTKKRIFRLLSVNHDTNRAKQTRDSVNSSLRSRKKTTSSPGRVLDGERLKSPQSAYSTPSTSMENVFIIEDNNTDISNLAENLQLDLFDDDLSPPSPDISLSGEMMTNKPWAVRQGNETPTKTQLRRGRPNTPTNGLHPALKKKYCHDNDETLPIDPDSIDELDSHVAVIVCNSKSKQLFASELAKDLFIDCHDDENMSNNSQTRVSSSDLMSTL